MAIGLNIAKIIKYEGPSDVLVWKHPAEDFNTASQLIVHESQEAVLFKNGKALDRFRPGRYTLETNNIPLLRRVISIPTGGKTPFHCEVYFINKADILNVLWGTAQPLPIQDPVYHIILPVRANGQFSLRVTDSSKLLVKLVGTTRDMTKARVIELFRGMLMTKVKSLIADLMTAQQVSFVEIHSRLNQISDQIRAQVTPMYEEYGMNVVHFFVNSISVPDNDPGYVKIRTALAAAKEKELLARGEKAQMDILGYSYQEKRTFDVLDRAAQNEGAGAGIMGAGIGMGLGVNVGGMVGNAMGSAMGNITGNAAAPGAVFAGPGMNADAMKCPSCGTMIPGGAKFCFECGTKIWQSCPKCGMKLNGVVKFCPECGKRLYREDQTK